MSARPSTAPGPGLDAPERLRLIREDLSRGFESQLRRLHALRPGPHARYALFPAILLAGFYLIIRALAHPGFPLSLYIPGVILSAVGMNSCFLVIHEATHGILFRNPLLNRMAGFSLAAFGFIAFSAYQSLHLRHHDFLGDPRDPDDYENYSKRPRLLWFLHCNRLAWGTLLYILAIPYVSLRCANPAQRRNILVEYGLLALVAAGLVWAMPFRHLVLGWFVPFLLTNWMINIRGFSQHGITDARDPYLASRSVLPHPLIRFFLINENFHLEHHLFPGVPGYNLAELHGLLRPRIPRRVVCPSYSAFVLQFLRQALSMNNRPIGLVQVHAAGKESHP